MINLDRLDSLIMMILETKDLKTYKYIQNNLKEYIMCNLHMDYTQQQCAVTYRYISST